MLGRTAKTVSPTRPLDVEATPDVLTEIPIPNFLTSIPFTMVQRPCTSRSRNSKESYLHSNKILSAAVTRAQTFGAQ